MAEDFFSIAKDTEAEEAPRQRQSSQGPTQMRPVQLAPASPSGLFPPLMGLEPVPSPEEGGDFFSAAQRGAEAQAREESGVVAAPSGFLGKVWQAANSFGEGFNEALLPAFQLVAGLGAEGARALNLPFAPETPREWMAAVREGAIRAGFIASDELQQELDSVEGFQGTLNRILNRAGFSEGIAIQFMLPFFRAARLPVPPGPPPTTTRRVGRELVRPFREQPGLAAATEVGLATTGGAGAGVAMELFPGSPLAELTGELIGTGVPVAGVWSLKALNSFRTNLSPTARARAARPLAREKLWRAADDPDTALARLEEEAARDAAGETVPGTMETTAQVTQDPGLGRAELQAAKLESVENRVIQRNIQSRRALEEERQRLAPPGGGRFADDLEDRAAAAARGGPPSEPTAAARRRMLEEREEDLLTLLEGRGLLLRDLARELGQDGGDIESRVLTLADAGLVDVTDGPAPGELFVTRPVRRRGAAVNFDNVSEQEAITSSSILSAAEGDSFTASEVVAAFGEDPDDLAVGLRQLVDRGILVDEGGGSFRIPSGSDDSLIALIDEHVVGTVARQMANEESSLPSQASIDELGDFLFAMGGWDVTDDLGGMIRARGSRYGLRINDDGTVSVNSSELRSQQRAARRAADEQGVRRSLAGGPAGEPPPTDDDIAQALADAIPTEDQVVQAAARERAAALEAKLLADLERAVAAEAPQLDDLAARQGAREVAGEFQGGLADTSARVANTIRRAATQAKDEVDDLYLRVSEHDELRVDVSKVHQKARELQENTPSALRDAVPPQAAHIRTAPEFEGETTTFRELEGLRQALNARIRSTSDANEARMAIELKQVVDEVYNDFGNRAGPLLRRLRRLVREQTRQSGRQLNRRQARAFRRRQHRIAELQRQLIDQVGTANPEVVQKLIDARAASAAYKQVFGPDTALGAVTGRPGTEATSALDTLLYRGGGARAGQFTRERAERFKRLVGLMDPDEAEALLGDVQSYLLTDLVLRSGRPGPPPVPAGVAGDLQTRPPLHLDAQKARAWLGKNTDGLTELDPLLRQTVEDLVTGQQQVDDLLHRLGVLKKDLDLASLTRATRGDELPALLGFAGRFEDPRDLVRKVMRQPNSAQLMGQLRLALSDDFVRQHVPDASDLLIESAQPGLRRAVWDVLWQDAVGEVPELGTGKFLKNPEKIKAFFEANYRTIQAAGYTNREMKLIRRLLDEAGRFNIGAGQRLRPTTQGRSEQVRLLDLLSSFALSASGAPGRGQTIATSAQQAGHILRTTKAGRLLAAAMFDLTDLEAEALFREALIRPEVARDLLINVSPVNARQAASRIKGHLVATGLRRATDEREEDNQ